MEWRGPVLVLWRHNQEGSTACGITTQGDRSILILDNTKTSNVQNPNWLSLKMLSVMFHVVVFKTTYLARRQNK